MSSQTNEKPRDLAVTRPQGSETQYGNSKSTTFKDGRSRYDKGMKLYKAGKISVGANGLFKVSGYYEADTEKMTCTCPDYRTRKEPCKHIYSALLFVKNRGKQTIENLEGHSNGAESKQPSNKPVETHSKPFDRQFT